MSKPNIVQPIYTVFFCPHFQCKVMKPFEISWLDNWLIINMSQQLHGRCLLKTPFKLVRRQLPSHHFCLKYMKSLWTITRVPLKPFLKYHFLFWEITHKIAFHGLSQILNTHPLLKPQSLSHLHKSFTVFWYSLLCN